MGVGNKSFAEVLAGLRNISAMPSSLKGSSGKLPASMGHVIVGLSTSGLVFENGEDPKSSVGRVSSSRVLLGVNLDFRTSRESLVSLKKHMDRCS